MGARTSPSDAVAASMQLSCTGTLTGLAVPGVHYAIAYGRCSCLCAQNKAVNSAVAAESWKQFVVRRAKALRQVSKVAAHVAGFAFANIG
eukprot:3573039-Amphidinium_carterae.1